MGFPWYSETKDDTIDWNKVSKSFDKYFARLNKVGCCVVLDNIEIFVFEYKDMKIGYGEGN